MGVIEDLAGIGKTIPSYLAEPPAAPRRRPRRPNVTYPLLREPEAEVRAPGHTADLFKSPQSFRAVVEWVADKVRAGDYEAIAGSGNSGLLVIGAVAALVGVHIIAVRKMDDHPKGDSRMLNCSLPASRSLRYAFVDDFIASGETIQRVHNAVAQYYPKAEMAGAILYHAWSEASARADLRYSFGDRAELMLLDIGGETLNKGNA
jgi:adenine/guanine phosphoribosyltransferase-like PRPP-binding protein